MDKNPKILVISGSGMGCSIMFSPTLKLLRDRFPKAEIHFLGISKSFVEPVRGSDLVDKVLVFDFKKDSLFNLKKLGQRLRFIKELRRQKLDYSLCVFPSNKWYFNVYAWLSGAKKRVTHRYAAGGFKTLSWLQNAKVPADPGLHDVQQNINLLKVLGIEPPKTKLELSFHIDESDVVQAKNFLK